MIQALCCRTQRVARQCRCCCDAVQASCPEAAVAYQRRLYLADLSQHLNIGRAATACYALLTDFAFWGTDLNGLTGD